MRALFISATGTNVGKTYTTLRLLEEFYAQGFLPFALKPIETGALPLPQDSCAIFECMERLGILRAIEARSLALQKGADSTKSAKIDLDFVCFERFSLPASPFVSALSEEKKIDLENIFKRILRAKKIANPLLIEGAGGLFVPILRDFFMIDIAKNLNAHTLLVIPARLGAINEALLSIEALKARNISHTLVLNIRRDEESEFMKISAPFWEKSGLNPYFLERDLSLIVKNLSAKLADS